MTLARRPLLAGLGLAMAHRVRAGAPVQVYAAMTFRTALDAVLQAYRDSGGAATATYGPTPVLVRQIEGGARADIFLSADPDWMDDATRRGLIRADTRAALLGNDLVLAGPPGAAAVGEIAPTFPLAALLGNGRLAMCDPESDPAGRYAKQSLQALGLWAVAAPHIAIAPTSLAAVTFVDHGEAPAAICFATDLRSDSRAAAIGRFPPASHAPIVYPVALTSGDRSPDAAAALDFLRSTQARKIFVGFGYQPPP